MPLLEAFLLLIQVHLLASVSLSKTACESSCYIKKICNSQVLRCQPPNRNNNDPAFSQAVNCEKQRFYFLIDSKVLTIIDFIDPQTFKHLIREGMKSLIMGVAVRYVTRYTFTELPYKSDFIFFLNGFYIKQIENFTFEEKKINAVFYSNPSLMRLDSHNYTRAQVKKTTFCDSYSSPCLCKDFHNINGTFMKTFSTYYNETSGFVCKNFKRKRCTDTTCVTPTRQEYVTSLVKTTSRKVSPYNYCIKNHSNKLKITFILLFVCFLCLISMSLF